VSSDGGVLILKKPDGKSTGDAFVMFENELEAELAMSKQKNMMGRRYIELFLSSSTEVAQVINKNIETVKKPK
jgi:epithelial splicing regulatory protein 1/2